MGRRPMRSALLALALLATPAVAGYLEGEIDTCLDVEMTLGIHGAADDCWRVRQEQAREALAAWQAIRPDVVAECADSDPVRAIVCVWESAKGDYR
jgi:hypothetical protein